MKKRRSWIAAFLALTLTLTPVSFAWAQEEILLPVRETEWQEQETGAQAAEDSQEQAAGAQADRDSLELAAGEAGKESENEIICEDGTEPAATASSAPEAAADLEEGSADRLAEEALLIPDLVEESVQQDHNKELSPVLEELSLEDPDIAPDGAISSAQTNPISVASPRKAPRRVTASTAQFNGVYGDQLSGLARQLYDSKVQHFVKERSTGFWQPRFTEQESLCSFEAVCVQDASGSPTYAGNDASAQQKEFLKEAMQSAADAFKHDFPQTFWFRTPGTYQFSFVADDWEEGEERTFHLALINYQQIEAFSGAYHLLDEVDAGIDSVVQKVLNNAALAAEGGTPTQEQKLRAILDYILERAVYDNAALAAAEKLTAQEKQSGTKTVQDVFRIYTCAGLFSDAVSPGVVCEGYAKAFKILCDRSEINIPCVLLCGTNHMWNAVQLEGVWYLVDPTWCDTTAGSPTYKYFLTYDAGRAAMTSANFSDSQYTTLFALPTLSTVCYKTAHPFAAGQSVPSTCLEYGHTVYVCTMCGEEEERTHAELGAHTYTKKQKIDPTCTEGGYTVYACTVCGAETTESETQPLGHSYQVQVVEPTTISRGYTVHTCIRCQETYTDTVTKKLLKKKPRFKKLKVTGKRTLRLTWKKGGSHKAYEVQIATKADFSDAKTRTFKAKKSEKTTITRQIRVKKNTRYYVRIRAVHGDRHSAWTVVRSRKTKK